MEIYPPCLAPRLWPVWPEALGDIKNTDSYPRWDNLRHLTLVTGFAFLSVFSYLVLEIVLLSDLRVKGFFFKSHWWYYEDEVIMIVPARSPSEPELWSEYSNKGGNCSESGPPPGMCGPQPTGPRALSLPPRVFFFVLDLFYPLCRVQMKCWFLLR